MELKNQGTFSVVYLKQMEKYVIVYNEKGIIKTLSTTKYAFDFYEAAEEYIKVNIQELDEYVTNLKEAERKKREEEEAEQKRKEEEEKKAKEEKEKKKKQHLYGLKRFIAGFLAAVVTLVGGHFLAKGISSSIKESKSTNSTLSTNPDEQSTEPTIDIIEPTEPTIVEETLTNEVYEEIVTNFTKQYVDNNVSVSTEDLIKFVSIANIDRLVEENPELASELFNEYSKEEYLNDAAKVTGMTYTYNRNIYNEEGSTENFIRISDALHGTSKEQMIAIEEYVDKFAKAKDDAEEVNKLAVEFFEALSDPESKLSYLDDGVGFAMQAYIELISDFIAKDTLSQENRDLLYTLTSAERYVSNIFTVYDKCIGASGVSRKLQ